MFIFSAQVLTKISRKKKRANKKREKAGLALSEEVVPDDEREADYGHVEGWANAEELGSDEEDEDYLGESDDESELEEGGSDSEDSGSSYLDDYECADDATDDYQTDDDGFGNGDENKVEEKEVCVIGTGATEVIGGGVIDAGVIELNDDAMAVNSVSEIRYEITGGMVGDGVEEYYEKEEVVTTKKYNTRMASQRSFYDLRNNTKRA